MWPDDFRLMLHASSLCFTHPVSQEKMTIQAELGEQLLNILSQLEPFTVNDTWQPSSPFADH